MPIPEYLQKYAVDPQTKKNHTAFDLRCTCGHELFRASRRVETKEEKRLVRPYYDYLLMVFSGPRKVTKEEDGTVRHWHTENGEWVEDPERVNLIFTATTEVKQEAVMTTKVGDQEIRIGKGHILKSEFIEFEATTSLDVKWGE